MSTNSFFKIKSMNQYSQNIENNNEHSANNGTNETVKLRTNNWCESKEASEMWHAHNTHVPPTDLHQSFATRDAAPAPPSWQWWPPPTPPTTAPTHTNTHIHTCHSMLHCTLATRSRHVQTRQALCSWSSATDSARSAPHAPLSTLLCPFLDQIQPIRHYTHTHNRSKTHTNQNNESHLCVVCVCVLSYYACTPNSNWPLYSGRDRSDASKFNMFHLNAKLHKRKSNHTHTHTHRHHSMATTLITCYCNVSKTPETSSPTASWAPHRSTRTNQQCWNQYPYLRGRVYARVCKRTSQPKQNIRQHTCADIQRRHTTSTSTQMTYRLLQSVNQTLLPQWRAQQWTTKQNNNETMIDHTQQQPPSQSMSTYYNDTSHSGYGQHPCVKSKPCKV